MEVIKRNTVSKCNHRADVRNAAQHPALYDEGKILLSGNKQQQTDLLNRYQNVFFDDGLKKLSASEYLQVPITQALISCRRMYTHAYRHL